MASSNVDIKAELEEYALSTSDHQLPSLWVECQLSLNGSTYTGWAYALFRNS